MAVCPGLTETGQLHHNLKEDTLNFIPEKFLNEAFEFSKYIQQYV